MAIPLREGICSLPCNLNAVCPQAYEGDRDADGKAHGYRVAQYADGDVYEGEYKADQREGRGTYHAADGRAQVGTYRAGKDVGAGVRWSADRQTAWRLLDGEPQAEISLDEATALAAQIGLPVPPPPAQRP